MWLPSGIEDKSVAVLASGGIESCVLLGRLPEKFRCVYPLYVRFGLSWEEVEERHLRSYLEALLPARVKPLTTLSAPVGDMYADHWSTSGDGIPDASTADSAVYLPGRNILFVAKASVWCALNGIEYLALGPLATNPFPDATDAFFESLETAVSLGLGYPIKILRPLAKLHKEEVMELGADLPLSMSFSCIDPQTAGNAHGIHCGACNKCHERQVAFMARGMADATIYANSSEHRHTARHACTK